jgi:hypothetical protein
MPEASYPLIAQAITASGFTVSEVVSGGARGADLLGEKYALETKTPCRRFPAEWNKFGRGAGYIRNSQMREYADAAIIFIWQNSRGSENMRQQMEKAGKPVFVVRDDKL